jgi:predicted phage tail protein
MMLIRGAGGGGGKNGGGGQHTPTEADDSLQSVQYASVLDLLSEGEIQGLDENAKSIYLDGTPVQSSSGTDNFSGYTVITRTGTQAQGSIPNATSIESEKAVGIEITYPTPVVRTITDTDVDRVRVTVQLPALTISETDGDIVGHSVRIQIQVQYNGGGYTTVNDDTISGKTTNSYQRDYIVLLGGSFPVDIKLVRVSNDETSALRRNQTYWSSYSEIIDEKLKYPNSALVGLRFDSRQFNNIPQRKYLIRGIKVRLPSNATVDTTTYKGRITYAGVWDGTFGAATWCADPAWCLWDLLTSTRYGAGIPESSLDRYDFYAISQYCNELVSNGFGALEPRFMCHVLLNSRDEIYTIIQEFVSIFRGIAYYGAGSMVVLADKPSDPQYILGPSNVIDGNFSYSGSSQKARHSTATVAYQSYESLGEVEFEYVEDSSAVAKYGVINKDLKAFGCYSRGQAHRLGKWALLTEQNLTETVSFGVSIDSGIVLRPGMVVGIADPVKSGSRRSGRIASATTTAITVDSTSGLPTTTANSPTISVLLPTGLVETRNISSIAGSVFTVSSAFSEAPNPAGVFLIETTNIQSNLFRVLSVAEGQDGAFSITALSYNESLYAAIESDLSLEFRDISDLSAVPDPPNSVTATEHLYVDGQSVLTAVELSWISPVSRVDTFRVEYRLDNNNWSQLETASPSVRLTGLKAGTLYVQVRSMNGLGKLSPAATAQFELVGKTAPPGDVTNLTIEPISANSARLRWDQTIDLDVKTGGKIYIRHTNLTDGSGTWSNSVDLIPAKAGAATEAIVPLVEGQILAKFEDDGGRQSVNEASVIVDFPDALGYLVVDARREDQDAPPFQGTKDGVFYSDEFDALAIDGDSSFDAIPDLDLVSNIDYLGNILTQGEYTFASTLDLGGIYALDLKRYFVTRGFYPTDTIDSRFDLIDDWTNFDGDVVDQVNARLLLRSTNDDPTGTPTWSDWQDFVNGTFLARAFQFKAQLESSNTSQNILIDALGYEATFQRRTDQSTATIASGAGSKAVVFDDPFYTLGGTVFPAIGITAQNMASGDYYQITSISGTGFTITFRNSTGTAVDRNFTYSATGYGKRV